MNSCLWARGCHGAGGGRVHISKASGQRKYDVKGNEIDRIKYRISFLVFYSEYPCHALAF